MHYQVLLTVIIVFSCLYVLVDLDNNRGNNHFVTPCQISTSGHFWDSFGNWETEVSAHWIVRFCKEQRSWKPFTRKDLTKFYNDKCGRKESFWMNGLDNEKYLTKTEDGKGNSWIKVTPLFIGLCWVATQ